MLDCHANLRLLRPRREPHDLLHRSRVMATERPETFTVLADPNIEGDYKITYHGEEAKLRRAKDLGDLVNRFAKWLPATVNLTFTKHDQPACALGYQHKERLLELAAEGDCEEDISALCSIAQIDFDTRLTSRLRWHHRRSSFRIVRLHSA